ncbi:hypothetical protein [Caulobacter sp. RL271]|jgi:hypothetical protein|uniref:Lipoprotein n=1 Tax=Caulobacter segnis TaxID=88688 RepID=A0ABY4ZYQ6_9CAUL|nr:hypothetical protein [Caulobacter segnis]USQ97645.1 hypothetical protein MZV50_08975 [Caulobacter segnis]
MRQLFSFKPTSMIAALLLAACAVPARHDAGPRETWGFAAASEAWPAKLIYGLDNTDVVSLGFTCHAGSGRAQIVVFVSEEEETWPERLELHSGKARQTFDLIPPVQADLPVLNADIDPASPLAAAFAQTGQLESTMGGVRRSLGAADNGERRAVSDFWRSCVGDRSSKPNR